MYLICLLWNARIKWILSKRVLRELYKILGKRILELDVEL